MPPNQNSGEPAVTTRIVAFRTQVGPMVSWYLAVTVLNKYVEGFSPYADATSVHIGDVIRSIQWRSTGLHIRLELMHRSTSSGILPRKTVATRQTCTTTQRWNATFLHGELPELLEVGPRVTNAQFEIRMSTPTSPSCLLMLSTFAWAHIAATCLVLLVGFLYLDLKEWQARCYHLQTALFTTNLPSYQHYTSADVRSFA